MESECERPGRRTSTAGCVFGAPAPVPPLVSARRPDPAPRRRTSAALLHGDELVRHETVRLAVHPCGGLGVRGVDQAEDLAGVLVEPVALVVDAVGVLHLEVPLVGAG